MKLPPTISLKVLIIVASLLFNSISLIYGQIGHGIVKVNVGVGTSIDFYSDTTKIQPNKHVEIIFDERINSLNLKDMKIVSEWLQPESLWLDYHSFFFRCIQQTDKYYQVIVNKETGSTYWIEKEKWLQYQDWETFLKDVLTISRIGTQDIKSQPNTNSESIEFNGDDCFHVLSMKGDWIEITTEGLCSEEELTNGILESGWIKWRHDDIFLVKYFLTM